MSGQQLVQPARSKLLQSYGSNKAGFPYNTLLVSPSLLTLSTISLIFNYDYDNSDLIIIILIPMCTEMALLLVVLYLST